MDPNAPRFRYDLVVLVLMLLVGGVFWFVRNVGNPFVSPSAQPVPRQWIPPPSFLELPPTAPLPPGGHPFFSRITPEAAPGTSPSRQKKLFQGKKRRKLKSKIPTRWEIIKQYQQVIELDMKYVQIAVTSDRYGYRNQAVTYYRKYLLVAPTGPYANQVRRRLSQLENAP